MRKLSQKEQAVLECIRRLSRQNGYSPSVRDIGAAMGFKSTSTVQMYLDRLAEYGYIRRAEGKSRSILLCEPIQHQAVGCLRKGILPSRVTNDADLDGELSFSYREKLPSDARLIAVLQEEEWWVLLQCASLPEDKPKIYLENARLTVKENTEGECIGSLLAVIRQC
ncbi:MAG: helix-turn-helix domain-containing protein [Clostridia bacterium]|nr:helix-turn-helix domain-containing protein [Clostridia bacterium]